MAEDEKELAEAQTERGGIEDIVLDAKNFFSTQKKVLGGSAKSGEKVVKVNFQELSEFSPDIAESLINKPEDTTQLLELALQEIDWAPKEAKVRLTSISKDQEVKIRNIRAKDLGKMISIEGIVRQASEVRPKVVNAKFECPACGTIISVLQLSETFKEPTRCSCGRRGGFKELNKDMVDAQRLVLEESPDALSGGEQPKRMTVFLKEDLVEPRMEEKTTPGSKVKVIGVLKEITIPAKMGGGVLTRFDLAVEANNLMPMEESFEDVKVSEEDEQQIRELAADPRIMEKLAESIAPSVWGYPEIKQSLALQLLGGVQKRRSDGTFTRGDLHILLVGDPGVAKSVMLKFISTIAPKGRYVSGKSSSGAGLTATVVKDEFLRGWALEAGAMVLSNKGLVCIDELEKMDENDRSTMHEAMEQQCMLPDFKLMLSNGDYVKIGEFVDNLISKNKNKVYAGKDCEILPVENVELLSTDFNFHFSLKAARVSRHLAPKKFVKLVLSNGREITVTPEHPCWTVKDGKIITVAAECLKENDFFPVPSKINIHEENYEIKNDYLCKILGYHISDGCYELNRGKKTGIQFWNNNEELINDYKLSIKNYFNINPIITKRKNQFAVRVISKKVFEEFQKIDPNLLEKGNLKRIPHQIMKLPKENIRYLLSALYDGDGSVSLQNRNGCRISFVSENRELAEQVSDLLLRFEIQSSIFWDNHSSIWRIDISGQENLSRFMVNIGFLSSYKQTKLKAYCEKEKTYRTITDVVPNCTDKINEIFKKLKISARKEIGHSIDLGVEKQRIFLQKLVKIALAKAMSINAKEIIEELKTLERLAFGYSRWVKIKSVSKIKNQDTKWVYDVTIEPHHTFISNGMILHNTVTISKANVQACYSADTQVLTEEGWKKYSEVGKLKIAQFNPKTKEIKFLPHRGLFIYNYNKEMYHFKDKRNDILVTPNHKMLFRESRQKEFQALPAEEIKYSRIEFQNSGKYNSKGLKEFILPAEKHKQNRTHEKYIHQHTPKKIPIDLWLEFLGYYVSEGGTETLPTISITQKAGKNAEKIENCLRKLALHVGFTLTKIPYKQYFKFKITNTQLSDYLVKNCGKKVQDKIIPLNLTELSISQLGKLFDALMLGDGTKDGKSYGSTSEILADQVQMIGLLLGKSVSKHLAYKEKSRGNRMDFYRVVFSDQITPAIKMKNVRRIKYSGKVWCFSTQTGFFVTRRNGKIAIQGNTLRAQTSVLAAANPKFGRFDPMENIPKQVNLAPSLLNRFDVLFILRDIPSRTRDESIAAHVLQEHKQDTHRDVIERDLLRKYISFAKQKCHPVLTNEAIEKIKKFYVNLRNQPSTSGDAIKPIPISARQLEALVRLAEATAKARLGKTVTADDAQKAIDLMKYYMMQVGYDEETKSFDIDKISGNPASKRNKIHVLKELLQDMETRFGKLLPMEELEKECEGKLTKEEFEETLDKLVRAGDLFRPKKGYVQRM